MTTLDKVRWTLGLAVVFLLLLLTGRSNVHHTKTIQKANQTLYADRLLVKGLIFELSSILHEKELAMARGDQAYFAERAGASTAQGLSLLEDFRATYLVPTEQETLERFTKTFAAMKDVEAALATGSEDRLEGARAERLAKQVDALQADLAILSRIQLDEGRRQVMVAGEAVEKMDLFATVETYLLAGIGVLAIFVILFIPRRATS